MNMYNWVCVPNGVGGMVPFPSTFEYKEENVFYIVSIELDFVEYKCVVYLSVYEI